MCAQQIQIGKILKTKKIVLFFFQIIKLKYIHKIQMHCVFVCAIYEICIGGLCVAVSVCVLNLIKHNIDGLICVNWKRFVSRMC